MVTVLTTLVPPVDKIITFRTRNIRKLDRDKFVRQIEQSSFIANPSDLVDDFCEQMKTDITSVLNTLAPETVVTKRDSNHISTKLTPEASSAKRERRALERKYQHNRTEENRKR
jgi:hypothetical protein